MKNIFILLVLIIIFDSCKKADAAATELCDDCVTFYFENPQPDNDSELNGFPSKFKGLYMNNDSTYIRIEEDRILSEYFYKFKVHKNYLDTLKQGFDLINNQLIDKETHEKWISTQKGDSLELSKINIDTLFRFSLNQKAKRINGQLVLSTRDSIFWNIKTIALEKNILKIKRIYRLTDLTKLDSITSIKGKELDSISYLIKPTRREFKNILKIKNLGTDKEYDKLSK
ncbi:hypothetical protein [Flavobacterium reichenbachii]|uniref:Uncharacterized protein n=1 Tax=Flavobacterium reichenbachii TaxID=362418 RepID=A0A085ZNC0_9FLAO|nr:hypothetical protein [Flavobacterium reichenbachii]KFF05934.1 hypothetical protein IW19_10560 [Flavobacterium reichenbachii]OXB12817.1 hypothetical protein B0A68_18715 [Flavobacterium reichenbachii]